MTSRQARKLRREEERKAKKVAYKAGLREPSLPAAPLPQLPVPPNPELLDEFTPEFLAHAHSVRERIQRNVALMKQNALSSGAPGFVSQNAPMPEQFRPAAPAPKRSKAEINRANAAQSTGPRTPQGLAASSRNAFKHGLASGQLIIPGEDRAAFESLLESLLADHQPANTTEQMLIHEMAQSFWLTQRALRLQNDCFTTDGVDEKRLALFLRYQTTHERAFHKALNTLIRLQNEPRKANSGFVSQHDSQSQTKTRFVSQNEPSGLFHSPGEPPNAQPSHLAEAA
jgi:hypothetical protein